MIRRYVNIAQIIVSLPIMFLLGGNFAHMSDRHHGHAAPKPQFDAPVSANLPNVRIYEGITARSIPAPPVAVLHIHGNEVALATKVNASAVAAFDLNHACGKHHNQACPVKRRKS